MVLCGHRQLRIPRAAGGKSGVAEIRCRFIFSRKSGVGSFFRRAKGAFDLFDRRRPGRLSGGVEGKGRLWSSRMGDSSRSFEILYPNSRSTGRRCRTLKVEGASGGFSGLLER